MKKNSCPLPPSRINKNNKELPNNKRVTKSEKKKKKKKNNPHPTPL
jgi:hypothetical protein